ncbi:MAG: CRTAC1 family protein [Phycisphaerales bacterium]|nr:CRTAC1 family protein [Phycisphaerales bacterium]
MSVFGFIVCACTLSLAPIGASVSSRPADSKAGPIDRSLRLTDVGASIGIGPARHQPGMGTGMNAADYDNDGDIDLFVAGGFGDACQLYRNEGGVFTDVALDSGLTDLSSARSALWFDADGDNLLDLVILHDQFQDAGALGPRTLALYQQQSDHSFVEVTIGSGLDTIPLLNTQTHAGAIAAGDLNGDDLLDLVVTTWDQGVWVFRNDGLMQFTDITEDSPLDGVESTFWQPVMFDQDGDDDLDVFIAHDFFANFMLDNDGTGSFIDAASDLGVDSAFNEMGVAVGDCDNDGDFDLYVSNLYGSPGGDQEHNVFFTKSNTDAGYTEDAVALGVDNGGWGWGTVFLDFDNDGRLDLAEVNAIEFGGADVPWKLWMNRGPMVGAPEYIAREAEIGFDSDDYGSALVHADIDRDGDLDLATTVINRPVRVFKSNTTVARPFNHWLVVRPRMPGTMNTRAIGAVVIIKTGNVSRMRLISAGTSFMAQVPAEAHFGLGNATSIDELIVRWPNGTQTVLTDVDTRQVIDVTPAVPRSGSGLVEYLRSKLRSK